MRKLVLWIAAWIVLGLSACMLLPVRRPPIAPVIDTSKACANWRWIGIKKDPAALCPKVSGWSERPLFGRKDPGPQCLDHKGQVRYRKVIEDLNRFCVYEIADPEKDWRDLPSPGVGEGLVRVDRDCAALSPSALDLEAKTWKPLFDHFLAQAGSMKSLPGIDKQPSVRLAFLDTEPTGNVVPSDGTARRSRHGYTLAHIARQLVCDSKDSKSCAAQITTQLALPIVSFDPNNWALTETDETQGGFMGTWFDLADAIDREIYNWRRQKDPERHLILNLSLGWDGKLFKNLSPEQIADMSAGAQAVYSALQNASVHGALVLAAAGNQNYGPEATTGPLLPAGWERGLPELEGYWGSPEEPVVYAVGGVQSDGFPLVNARRGGLPQRVAYADHAVVPAFNPKKATAMYTGSSVSTAVASSIAAVIWNARPELSAREVMAILDRSGEVFDGSNEKPKLPADFWFSARSAPRSEPPWVHRLSLCAAVREATCSATDSVCRERFPCNWDPARPHLSPLLPDVSPRIGISVFSSVPSPCGAERMFYMGSSPRPPYCPSEQFSGINSQPWLFPQPQDNPCPNCVGIPPPERIAPLSGGREFSDASSTRYRFMGAIPTTWEGCLVGATLDVERPGTIGRQRFSVTFPDQVCSGDEFNYTTDFPMNYQRHTTAILSFVFQRGDQTFSVQSPMLLAQ
jgi:hypothetical protein